MTDHNDNNANANAHTPLLATDRTMLSHTSSSFPSNTHNTSSVRSYVAHIRASLRHFLTSKYGHYFVMILVTLDVAGIFADFLISLHVCEHKLHHVESWERAQEVLEILSLVFSCLFMGELLCSIWAFGFGYFRSKFHCFDATAILASFLVDVLLRGPVEEAGSLIIILRLFRVFKIVEESGTVAQETVEGLNEKIERLEEENRGLRLRVTAGAEAA